MTDNVCYYALGLLCFNILFIMKQLIASFLLVGMSMVAAGQTSETYPLEGTSGFRHPGCLHSEGDFDRIFDMVRHLPYLWIMRKTLIMNCASRLVKS